MDATPDQAEALRAFNRFYTQRIGVLRQGLLDSPYSLTEVRVLYELSRRESASAGAIAVELGLDPGYLSRIVRRFERDGLVARAVADDDARRRTLTLTAKGRRAFAPLDRRSSDQAAALLAPLALDRRTRMLSAMGTIRTLLGADGAEAPHILLRTHQPGDIGWTIERHGALYAAEHGYDAEFEALVAEIGARFLRRYDPARERCWIAERDGERVGCVFLVAKSRTVAQLRMLLLEPSARGIGLGRRLVDECVRFARGAGYRKIVLWTQNGLEGARRVYTHAGFRKTEQYSHRSFGHALVAEIWELALKPA